MQNNDKHLPGQNNPRQTILKKPLTRSFSTKSLISQEFLLQSKKKIQCLKCREMIHFEKIDFHQMSCKGQSVECLYCFQKISMKSINVHEILCPGKKQFDRQQKKQKQQDQLNKINKIKPFTKRKNEKVQFPNYQKQLKVKPQPQPNPQQEEQVKPQLNQRLNTIKTLKTKDQKHLQVKQMYIRPKIANMKQQFIQPLNDYRNIQIFQLNKNIQIPKQQKVRNYRGNYQPIRPYGLIRQNHLQQEVYIPPEPQQKKQLTQTKIQRLPRVTYQLSQDNNETICSICYLDFEENDDLVRFQQCKHLFHHECIAPWLKTDNRCAKCKQEVKVPSQIKINKKDNN